MKHFWMQNRRFHDDWSGQLFCILTLWRPIWHLCKIIQRYQFGKVWKSTADQSSVNFDSHSIQKKRQVKFGLILYISIVSCPSLFLICASKFNHRIHNNLSLLNVDVEIDISFIKMKYLFSTLSREIKTENEILQTSKQSFPFEIKIVLLIVYQGNIWSIYHISIKGIRGVQTNENPTALRSGHFFYLKWINFRGH